MKVLLIEPPKEVWEMMGDCVAPPLDLAYVAGTLEQAISTFIAYYNQTANPIHWSYTVEKLGQKRSELTEGCTKPFGLQTMDYLTKERGRPLGPRAFFVGDSQAG